MADAETFSRVRAPRRHPEKELSSWAVHLIDAFVERVRAFRREACRKRLGTFLLMSALLYPPSRVAHEAAHLLAGILFGAEAEGAHIGSSWPLDAPVVLASFKVRMLDLYLRVEPNLLAGAHLRWDTREVWWVLRPLIAAAGPATTFCIGRLAWRGYSHHPERRWLFALYAVNLALFLLGFAIPLPGTDGHQFWRMILRRE